MMDEAQTNETIARVDERTRAIQTDLSQLRDELKTTNSNIVEKLRDVETRQNKKIDELENLMLTGYVRKTEFTPVKILVYGFVGMILTAVFTAMLASVVHQAPTFQPPTITLPKAP